MAITNTQMLRNSMMKAEQENLKVYRNGSIGREHNFIVVNNESTDAYEVTTEDGYITGCTCGHAHFRKTICKHQLKVSDMYGLNIGQLTKKKANASSDMDELGEALVEAIFGGLH